MQYRVYDRQTLKYKNGGYVMSYSIDDDYIVNNNSTITVVKQNYSTQSIYKQHSGTEQQTFTLSANCIISSIEITSGNGTVISYTGNSYTLNLNGDVTVLITYTSKAFTLSEVSVGDIIVLIQDSGVFHKGVITTVDDTARTISYKSDKELFNDNMLNPFIETFTGEGNTVTVAGKFGLEIVINIFKTYFTDTNDSYKKLPIGFIQQGDVLDDKGEPKMLWTWDDDQISFVDWLVELFEKYNVSMSFTIDFNIAEETLDNRQANYIVTFSAITNSGGVIKDNVDMQTITYTEKELPDATVCYVIDSQLKNIVQMSSGKNLLNPATVKTNTAITCSGSNIFQNESENTNVSAYIAIKKNTDYTFSINKSDRNITRFVIFYDNEKNLIGYFSYYATSTNAQTIIFNTNNFNEGNSGYTLLEEASPDDIKFIRINYYNEATEVQLEEGDIATDFDPYNRNAIYYLYEKDGEYSISTEVNDTKKYRVLPVKTVIATFNQSAESTDVTTPEEAAENELIPSKFNQAIEIRINSDSKMFDFVNARLGDLYKIINQYGTIDSVFTGKKFNNNDKWVTLYFGLGRQHYTDLIQMRLRKNRYHKLYNQG